MHGMMLMCGADGNFEQAEMETVEAYFAQLPEFRNKEFSEVYDDAVKILRRYPSLKDSVKGPRRALHGRHEEEGPTSSPPTSRWPAVTSRKTKTPCSRAMQRVLEIDDRFAQNVLEVLSVKYQPAT
jgi:hypothetical protein